MTQLQVCGRSRVCSVWWLVMLVGLLCPMSWADAPTLAVAEPARSYSMQNALQYWRDDAGTIDIDALLEQEKRLPWGMLDKGTPNFGFDSRPYWYRLHLSNELDREVDLMLEIDYPVLDYVDLYVIDSEGQRNTYHFGDKIPFNERNIKHTNFVLPLELNAKQRVSLYLRVQTNGAHQIPVTLWSAASFQEQDVRRMMGQGAYFGIMVVMVVYNLFVFFSVRDTSYLYYVAAVASFAIFQATLHGFSFQYLWPNAIYWNDTAISISLSMFGLTGSLFVLSFLQLKQHSRGYYQLLFWYAVLNASLVVGAFVLPYETSIKLSSFVGIFGNIIALVPGIHLLLKGHKHARYFIAGWSIFLTATFTLALNKFGMVPQSFLTEYGVQIASVLEVVMFSFALADRINFMRQEKERLETNAKQALLESNRSLEESNRLKDEFLATISHELRTPMNGVLGCLENMEESHTPVNPYQKAARQSATEMMRLVERILGYTEIQSGQLKLHLQAFDLTACCQKVVEKFAPLAETKRLPLLLTVDAQLPAQVVGDENHIAQVLDALLDNAIKFTDTGRVELQVRLQNQDEIRQQVDVNFCVCDTGKGIPTESVQKIFEKFRQIDGSFQRRQGGLGIGLAISQNLVQAMGSLIHYASADPSGSRFSFTLTLPYEPITKETIPNETIEAKSNTTAAPLNVPLDLNGKHVLVVEDNPVNQMVMKGKLKKQGANVIVADNGQIAVELIQQQPVDLVLMDCQMPVMDGFEATRAIRQLGGRYASVPIIAVTANAMSQDRDRCLASGMNDYLAKPVDVEQLWATLQKWL